MAKSKKGKTLLFLGLLLLSSNFAHGENYNCDTTKNNSKSYTITYNFSTGNSSKKYTYRWKSVNDFYKDYKRFDKAPIVPSKKPVVTRPISPKPIVPKVEKTPEIEAPKDKLPTIPVVENNLSSIEKEVVRLVNIERKKAGLGPFSISSNLSNVARIKSKDMAENNYFSHTSPTYGSPFDMMKQFNIKYNAAGENIAKGHPSAESVVKGWMNSPGHRANILNKNFNKIGVGAYSSANNTILWTQIFTN